jgi:predicted nucleic acid-binding protein
VILVDTAVWVDYLRAGDEHLAVMLRGATVATHPMALGELACGNLKERETLRSLWRNLPQSPVAIGAEALLFRERNRLWGRGIGYINVHLLVSVALDGEARLWIRDRRLHAVTEQFGLAYAEPEG